MRNAVLFEQLGVKIFLASFLFYIGGISTALGATCPDSDKPVPMNTSIDPCRLSKLTTLLRSAATENGLGSGYLMADIGNNSNVQFWYKTFYAVLDDTAHPGKVLVTRSFVVQDLKNWIPIFAKDGYNIILLQAVKMNLKGGTVNARFYDNVISGTYTDIQITATFDKNNKPEMLINGKVFDSIEFAPNKIFNKAIGIATLFFQYGTQQVLKVDID